MPDEAMAAEAMVIVQSFHKYRGEEVSYWKVLEVEEETPFELVPDRIWTIVFPDLVAWIPGHGITIVDHKVVYDFMQQKFVDLAGQPIKYFAGRRAAGIKVESAMFNQLRHRHLKSPTANSLFKFHYLDFNEARIFNTLKEQVIVAGRIEKLKELPLSEWEQKIVRNANKTVCNYCPFTDICREDLNGNDTSLMVSSYYVPRRRREEATSDAT